MEGSVQEKSVDPKPAAWQHSKNLGDCMVELYDNRLWTDVKFRCKDHDESERIHAHKVVLAARSPVFQAMFFGPSADKKDEVELDNAEAKILDLILRYIYSDTVILTEGNASAVLEMAHYFQVSNLVQFCADYLSTVITTENVCEILSLAMFYNVTTLRDACCTCIDRNADAILLSEGFLKLSVECLTYILKGDTFYVEENEIFNKAEEWSKRQISEGNPEQTGPIIRKTLGASFYYLRLPAMTSQTFMACTRKKGYLSLGEYEDIVDFINEPPAALSEKSNSCVARIPKEETLTVNNLDGEINISDNITTLIQISVSRDVKLTNLIVTRIHKHFKYDTGLYSVKNCPTNNVGESDVDTFFSQNDKKVLKLIYTTGHYQETRHRRNGSHYRFTVNTIKRSAQELKDVHGEDLSDKLDIVTSGTLKLTRQKDKILQRAENNKVLKISEDDAESGNGGIQNEVTEDEGGEESADGLLYSEGDENVLIYEQEFQLPSLDVTHRRIDLRKPLILRKDASPYTVEITMKYGCQSGVKMKTICSNTKIVRSEFGQLQIQDIAGQFAGIERKGFENISNREHVNDMNTSIYVEL